MKRHLDATLHAPLEHTMTRTIAPTADPRLIPLENGWFLKRLTLAFILKDDQVLLGFKKRGFGAGLWNGFGGKVDVGEEIIDAAAREIKEECGLEVRTQDLEQFAVIEFRFAEDPVLLEVHAFKTSTFSGEVQETEEMSPKWYPLDGIPYELMWIDDRVWYPFFLQNIKFKAFFSFEGHTKILSYRIEDYYREDNVLKAFNCPDGDGNIF